MGAFNPKHTSNKLLFFLLEVLFTSYSSGFTSVDKVIAYVNGYVILESEVNYAYDARRMGKEGGDEKCNISKEQIFDELVQQALVISQNTEGLSNNEKEQIKSDVNATIENGIRQCNGDKSLFEKQVGLSVNNFYDHLYETRKKQRLYQAGYEKIVNGWTITPEQVFSYYQTHEGEMPQVGNMYEVYRLVRFPPDPGRVLEKITKIREDIVSGNVSFSDMAEKYSQDLSAEKGGDMGVRKMESSDVSQDAYGSVIARLKKGEVSNVIESDSGYYLIKLVGMKGKDKYKSKMIYMEKEDIVKNTQKVENELNEIRVKLYKKEMNWEQAVKQYSQDDSTKNNFGKVVGYYTDDLTDDDLNDSLKEILSECEVKNITPVQTCMLDGKLGKCIYYFRRKVPAHKMNPDYDYEKIAQMATEYYKIEFFKKYMSNLIPCSEICVDYDSDICKRWIETHSVKAEHLEPGDKVEDDRSNK